MTNSGRSMFTGRSGSPDFPLRAAIQDFVPRFLDAEMPVVCDHFVWVVEFNPLLLNVSGERRRMHVPRDRQPRHSQLHLGSPEQRGHMNREPHGESKRAAGSTLSNTAATISNMLDFAIENNSATITTVVN